MSELTGHQTPRIYVVPEHASTTGPEAVELAAAVGLHLDPWQQRVLTHGLGERADGRWSAFETVVNVPRQNGKGGIIEARQLAGLFLLGERLIIHSAHEVKTSLEAFRRLLALIEGSDMLRARVRRVSRTNGDEGIELKSGARIRFMARSKGAGRGFSADCVFLDEAMILGDSEMGAIMPTLSAMPDPQLWYLGSAGIGSPSVQLGRLRRRALAGGDEALAYMEWSIDPHADECLADCAEHDGLNSPEAWARANPAMGIRVSQEHIGRERASMSDEVFGRERLGVGDYPSDGSDAWKVVGEKPWRALTDGTSEATGSLVFAVDATPERSHAAIGVAGAAGDHATHVEIIDHRPGLSWVVECVVNLTEGHESHGVVVDPGGPAGSLIPDLQRRGVNVIETTAREVGRACGMFYDAITDQSLVHLDQAPLATALAGAEQRTLGDAWAWARRGVSVDICPLMAVTLAAWGLWTHEEEEPPEPWVVFR